MFARPPPLRFAYLLLALLTLVGMTVRGLPLAKAAGAKAAGAPDLALIAALGGTICHDGAAGPPVPDPPAPFSGPCVLCPVCGMANGAGVLPVSAFGMAAADVTVRVPWAVSPPPRAPPVVAWIAAQPRAPPVLI